MKGIISNIHHRQRGSASPVVRVIDGFNGESKILTPDRLETIQTTQMKLGTDHYVMGAPLHAKFHQNRFAIVTPTNT